MTNRPTPTKRWWTAAGQPALRRTRGALLARRRPLRGDGRPALRRGERVWPYRDWVIRAFNDNKPFDRFTVEQLAGDLLPNRTVEQQVATGFTRCGISTSEGGSIEAELLATYAKEHVETNAATFLGLTMGCCACHDHKFDPISQKEFYEFSAFFRNTTQKGITGKRPWRSRRSFASGQGGRAALGTPCRKREAARRRWIITSPRSPPGSTKLRRQILQKLATLRPAPVSPEGARSSAAFARERRQGHQEHRCHLHN